MATYIHLAEHCAKIDQRSTKYQFDLDKDIRWDLLAAPGDYFPDQLLEDCGVDVGVLAQHPAAHELFQWAFALSTCRLFEDLEKGIVRTVRLGREELESSRSSHLLVEEEEKHILLFRRYAQHLEQLRPALIPRFNELYARCKYVVTVGAPVDLPGDAAFLSERYAPVPSPSGRPAHYMFWLSTLFVEEYTVYVHDRLAHAPSVQPAWRSAHEAHWREEVQHLATVRQILRSLGLSPEEQLTYSGFHLQFSLQKLRYSTGVDTPLLLVQEQFPELPVLDRNAGRKLMDSTFCEVLRKHPAFAQTRALPGFDQPDGPGRGRSGSNDDVR